MHAPDTLHNDSPLLSRRHALRLAAGGGAGLAATLLSGGALAQAPSSKLPRLVTVSGAITEVAYLLGAQGQVVGTDTTSLYPAEAQRTPKVGYMRQLSAEGLLSLKPDALIGTTECGPSAVLDQLRSAGVKVELIEADHSWEEVRRKVAAVGRAGAREREAASLQQQLDEQWAATQKAVAMATGKKPRVLFILAHAQSPSVSGEKTAADAVIRMAGAINCLSGFNGYRPMTAEAMASAAPDVVLTTTQGIETQGGADKFWSRPELALTPAYKRRALVHLDALQLLGMGPRLPATIRALSEQLVRA